MKSLITASVAAFGVLAAGAAIAQEYPESGKRFEVIVAASAGSGADITARLVTAALEARYENSVFQIVNMPGAGLQVGMQALADASKDGYTFGLTSLPTVITLSMDEARGAQFGRDSFIPLANFAYDPGAIAVNAESPFKTFEEFLESAKENPEERTVGVTGPGGREHLDVIGIEQGAEVSFTPVFHNDSGLALNALLGGHIDAVQGSVADFKAQVEAGRVRVLAVFDEERSSFLPDVPTAKEFGFEIYSGTSRGFALPAGTPDHVVDELNTALGEISSTDEMKERVAELGLELRYMDAEQYADYWDSEIERIERLTSALDQ